MKDKYDLAIEFLSSAPENIKEAWDFPSSKLGGCLFAYADNLSVPTEESFGCLTQIRATKDLVNPYCVPGRPDLTEKIQQDERIPTEVADIKPEHLPVFAEWQRILDKELGRI